MADTPKTASCSEHGNRRADTPKWYRRWVVREEVDTLLDDVYLVAVSHIVGRKLVHRDLWGYGLIGRVDQ